MTNLSPGINYCSPPIPLIGLSLVEGVMMSKLTWHAAVFCVGLAITALIAFLAPLDVDPRHIFFVFTIVFFLYLGISTMITLRRKPKI